MTHNPLSPERKISISLIKVIRRYIDNKYPFEKNMSSKLLDVFVQEIFVEAEDNADFQNKEEKDIFHYISEELSKDIKNIVFNKAPLCRHITKPLPKFQTLAKVIAHYTPGS